MDIYARAGAALVRVDYKDDTGGETHKFNDLKVSPVFAGGLEYAILPELALRLEYQWVARVGNFGKAERKKAEAYYGPNNYDESDVRYSPDIGSLSLGLSYRFDQNPVSVAQDTISATGYGKANPVTGNQCDAVKGRKALIACLADDRRVEIAVNGNQ